MNHLPKYIVFKLWSFCSSVTLFAFSADQLVHSNDEVTFHLQQSYKELLSPLENAMLCGSAHPGSQATDSWLAGAHKYFW